MSLLKRRLTATSLKKELTDDEQAIYDAIKTREAMGVLKPELKRELKTIKDRAFNNCINTLKAKQKIKEVISVQNKKVYFMAVEFEPSVDLTGGSWYSDGHLDMAFIDNLMKLCLGLIRKQKVATLEQLAEMVNKSRAFTVQVPKDQVNEILKTLVLDNEIMEVKSDGSDEYASIPLGSVCYRVARKAAASSATGVMGALASIPCGACPRIHQCTPDGVISPITCEYYTKWLEF